MKTDPKIFVQATGDSDPNKADEATASAEVLK